MILMFVSYSRVHSFPDERCTSSILRPRESYSVCSIAHSSSQSSQYVVEYMRILHNFTRYFYAKKNIIDC